MILKGIGASAKVNLMDRAAPPKESLYSKISPQRCCSERMNFLGSLGRKKPPFIRSKTFSGGSYVTYLFAYLLFSAIAYFGSFVAIVIMSVTLKMF